MESAWRSRWKRVYQWGLRLAEFGFVQGLVQLLTAAAGLLIVRTLSKPEYALFAIVNSMQTICNLLADLGIFIGLSSIGGRVYTDRARFGQLLNTALGLRRRLAVVSLSICLPFTMWMVWHNGGNATDIIGLSTVVAVGVIPLLTANIFSSSSHAHGEYRRMQKLDFGNAVLRIALIGALAVSRMTALLVAAVGTVTNWVQAFFFRRWARDHADPNAPVNEDDRRELQRIAKRWMPNVIFFCLQGQITLFILSLVGNSTGIADVTALGRLAVLFGIVSGTIGRVLVPRFACCQDVARLPRLYGLLVGGMTIAVTPVALAAWLFPEPFLWLLGGKYAGLQAECGWVVAASCVSQVGGVMWHLNSSKAWIRIQSLAFIPTILGAQVVAAFFLDLRQFHDVLIFNLVSSAAPVPIYLFDALLGFGKREI